MVSAISYSTRVLACALLAAAAAAYAWTLVSREGTPPAAEEWLALGLFAVLAAAGQLFRVPASSHQLTQTAMAFFFAGIILLHPVLLVILVLAAVLPEGIRFRYPWHLLAFKVSSLLIATLGGRVIYRAVDAAGQPLPAEARAIIAALAAALFLVGACHGMVYVLRRLHYTELEGSSGPISTGFIALMDGGVLCLGGMLVVLWRIDPRLSLLAVPPLLLAHRAFAVPVLREEARLDAKTGLFNARHFGEALEAELRRAIRFRRPMAVIMADLDLLRDINNRHGHLAGDAVLAGVGRIIARTLRDCDVAARFGGEEFAVILPETTAEQGLIVAERIRQEVAAARFEVPMSRDSLEIRVSLGVAAYPTHGLAANQLVHMADMAVYAAKKDGRNRSHLASAEQTSAVRSSWWDKVSRHRAGGGEPTQVVVNMEKPQGRQSAHRRATDLTWPIRIVVGALAAGYLLSAVVLLPTLMESDLTGLALFALLAVVAERYGVSIYGDSRVSISFVFSMAAAILFGSIGALVVGSLLVASVALMRGHALHKVVFNMGSLVLAAIVASLIFHAFRLPLQPSNLPYLLVAALSATMASYLVNTWLVALVVGLTTGQTAMGVWQEKFRWLFFHYVVLGVLSLLVAVAYSSLGLFGLLAFLAPPLMMRYAMKQFVDRTVENVSALKKANADLQASNDNLSTALHDLHETYEATLLALSTALDSRDSETEGHSRRVVAYSRALAAAMGLPEPTVMRIAQGALLHDVGKIGVPDAILLKQGPLSGSEWSEMRRHPQMGARILAGIRFLGEALPVVKYHHEKYDGSGYPDHLEGEQIPLSARIFSVADAIDAMTSDRPYRKALRYDVARQEIVRCAGSHFDPAVVQAFLSIPEHEWRQLSQRADAAASNGHSSRIVHLYATHAQGE